MKGTRYSNKLTAQYCTRCWQQQRAVTSAVRSIHNTLQRPPVARAPAFAVATLPLPTTVVIGCTRLLATDDAEPAAADAVDDAKPHCPSTMLSAEACANEVNMPPPQRATAMARASLSTTHPWSLMVMATEKAEANAVDMLPPLQKAMAVALAKALPMSPPPAAAWANAIPKPCVAVLPPMAMACATAEL